MMIMKIKTIVKIILPILFILLFIYIALIGIPVHRFTREFSSNVLYRDGIKIYKIFSRNPLYWLSGNFNVVESWHHIGANFSNKMGNERLIILRSKEKLQDFVNKFIFPDGILDNIGDEFFESYLLGIVEVLFSGSFFLRNPKIYDKENNLAFSIEVWDRNAILPLGAPRSVWNALFFLKIPKKNCNNLNGT